jgi:segregation and condensation protein B
MHDEAQLVNPRTILEAMLFVGNAANEPLGREQAAAGMRGVKPDEIDALVSELNAQYEELGCPYTIVDEGVGLRLTLGEGWQSLRQRFYGKIRRARLSQAAVDVLSIVAYQQPITREQVDELRGRESGPLLRQLVRRRLLRVELPQAKGAPRAYRTTDRFLELFGLAGLSDLPQGEDIRS